MPKRRDDLLPRTLASLALAGFEQPRLFIDGSGQGFERFGLESTFHDPPLRCYGNWVASLWELYVRDPLADRYAIFQDDFVTYRHLREYLEQCQQPQRGYLNLYTFPKNQAMANGRNGWYLSDQLGKGAVALVFTNEAVVTLLSSPYMVNRPKDVNRGYKWVDGGIVTAFKLVGWKEYVHNPSLVQHTGTESSVGNRLQPLALSFRGEQFDARELLT
ncbi:MAG: hypothetical protein WC485_00070 [Opitutaceae bacterium]